MHSMSELFGVDGVEAGAWLHFQFVATVLHEIINRGLVESHRLTLTDVRLLGHLRHHGPSQMGALAAMLMVTPSRVTQQTQRLERRDLVRRTVSSNDGRKVLASITRTGVAQLAAAMETYAKLVRTHFLGQLSRSQTIALGDGCRRISAALQAAEPSPRLPRA